VDQAAEGSDEGSNEDEPYPVHVHVLSGRARSKPAPRPPHFGKIPRLPTARKALHKRHFDVLYGP
jgi:hypothetical protein